VTYEEALRIARGERLPGEPKEDTLERWSRNRPEPTPRSPNLDITPVDWSVVIASALKAERAHMIEVVGRALGEFKNQLLDEVEQLIAEAADQVRVEMKQAFDQLRADADPRKEEG
jgi:hypothetical protein